MLRIENLKAGPQPPLTFEVADGECLAIEAQSGAGKTCLLRAIADLDPAPGQVFLDGAERGEMQAFAWRRLVRLVAAEPGWWSDTPRGSFTMAGHAEVHAAELARLDRLMNAVGLDVAKLDQAIRSLSTGERQRLALVRGLLDEPRVLLLDEPCASLDAASAALVEELIKYQLLSGRTVLLVSHDAGQVARLAHARLILPAPKRAAPANGAVTGATRPQGEPQRGPGAP